jgi:sec-independent protein translocase protein TatA
MGFDALSPWHLLIIAVIFVMLFGAKKLPDSARALGRSLRIFKAETSGLRHDENGNVVPEGQPQAQAQAQAQAVPPPPLPAPAPPPASGVTGAPVSEPQRTNQPS